MSLLHKWEIDAAMILKSHSGKEKHMSFYTTLWNEMKVNEKKSNEKPCFWHKSQLCSSCFASISHLSLPPVPILCSERERWREGPMHGHDRGVKSGMDRKEVSKFDRLLMLYCIHNMISIIFAIYTYNYKLIQKKYIQL